MVLSPAKPKDFANILKGIKNLDRFALLLEPVRKVKDKLLHKKRITGELSKMKYKNMNVTKQLHLMLKRIGFSVAGLTVFFFLFSAPVFMQSKTFVNTYRNNDTWQTNGANFLNAALTDIQTVLNLKSIKVDLTDSPTANGKIAFSSNRSGNYEIYTMNADGTSVTNITNTSSTDEDSPSWSPDGSKIVYDVNGDIYTMNADGSSQIRLTNNGFGRYQPKWSPNGAKIVYFCYPAGLCTMNADGSNQTLIPNTSSNDFMPSFSPDGTKILFASVVDENSQITEEIFTIKSDGTNRTRLTNDTFALDRFPTWSPDGTKIIFTSDRNAGANPNNWEIYTMDANGANITRITNNNVQDIEAKFSPDGTKLVIARRTTSDFNSVEIFTANTDGNGEIRLTTNNYYDADPSWQPVQQISNNGKIVFRAYRTGNGDVYTMNADGTAQTNIYGTPDFVDQPAISPDGSKIAFVKSNDIYTINADGSGTPLRLTNNSGIFDGMPAWSPDNAKIVFMSQRDGNSELYTMNADGTNQTRLTNNTVDDRLPHWSPDGTQIVFSRLGGNGFDIWKMNADGTGTATQLTTNNGSNAAPRWSPNGAKICFYSNRAGNAEIFTMNADGTAQTNLTNTASSSEFTCDWSPDGSRIIFDTSRNGNYDIYTMDSSNGGGLMQLTTDANNDDSPSWQRNGTANSTYSISGQITANGNILSGVTVNNSCAVNAIQTDTNGNYSFTGLTAGNNCTVTPSLANYNFTPTSQTFNNLSANQTANFTAASSCTYSISPGGMSLPDTASTGNSVTVTTQTGCQWSAASSDNWITVTNGTSRTDSGTLNYSVTANSGSPRTGSITIAGNNFSVSQSGMGAPIKVCKIAGTGIPIGTLFQFDVTGTDAATGAQITRQVQVPAGQAQSPICNFVRDNANANELFLVGSKILVDEIVPTGNLVSGITADTGGLVAATAANPATVLLPSGATDSVYPNPDLRGGRIVITAQASYNEVGFTNTLSATTLKICAASGQGLEDRIFQYDIGGNVYEASVNGCTDPIDLAAGSYTITELNNGRLIPSGTFTGRFKLLGIGSSDANSLGSVNTDTRAAVLNVGENTGSQTVVTFTNTFAVIGFIEICKQAAANLTVTGFFSFTVDVVPNQTFVTPVGACTGPIRVNVPTSPGPGGPQAADVRVTEIARAGFSLQSADTNPSTRFNSLTLNQGISNTDSTTIFTNTGGGYASVKVFEASTPNNETQVNFYNSSNTINGRITHNGNSLSGVSVALTGVSPTTTDAQGNYYFTNLTTGENYTVTPSLANYIFTPANRTFNNLSGKQTANFTAVTATQTISGNITKSGVNLQGVTVSLSGSESATTNTDTNGNYSFTVATGGNYTVTPSLANNTFTPTSRIFNSISSNQTGNFTAQSVTYTISGNVKAEGANLQGATVSLSGATPPTTTTDASGNYSLTANAGDNYSVSVYKAAITFNPSSQSFTNLQANQTADFQNGAPLCAPPPSGLVAWYKGENNANDSSGNNNNGLLRNGAVSNVSGKVGQAFGFDGQNDDVQINGSSTLDVGAGNGLTIETWINTTTLSNEKAVAEWNNGGFGVHLWINTIGSGFSSGRIFANVADTQGNSHYISTDSAVVTANSFQHIALTYNKSNGITNLFYNGSLVKQQNLGIFTPQTSPAYPLYLGSRPGRADSYFQGTIDELKVFNRALSALEIGAIYNAGSAGVCTNSIPTVSGAAVTVAPANNVNLNFSNVSQSGNTVAAPLSNSQLPAPPSGYNFTAGTTAYDIRTSAGFSGNIAVTLDVSNVADSTACGKLQILHYENGAWTSAGNGTPTYNAGTQVCTVSQTVTSLSPFAVAIQTPASFTYEADVQNRPNGDGFVDSDDTQQIRLFSVGSGVPYQSNEFQRADCSPRSTSGDGYVDGDDVQQARRYSVGTDSNQLASGPTSGSILSEIDLSNTVFRSTAGKTTVHPIDRTLETPAFRVGDQSANVGQTIVVPFRVDTTGNEAGYTFSLDYDSAQLTNPQVSIGNAGGDVVFNSKIAGKIGFSVTSFTNGKIAAGNNLTLVNVTFTVAPNAAGTTTLSFTDSLARRKAAGVDPNNPIKQPDYKNGTITINGAAAFGATVGGRVLTQTGRGIRNVLVTLTDAKGSTRTATTTSFGYYEFRYVPKRENYTIEVRAKRYKFGQPTQSRNISGDIDDVIFVADGL